MARSIRPYQRLKVYQKSCDLGDVLHQICEKLPPEFSDLREIIRKHDLTIMLSIVRGAGRPPRKEALRHFRMATRSAEFCESVLIGLRQSGITSVEIEKAFGWAGEVKAETSRIAALIQSGARAPDVFRDA